MCQEFNRLRFSSYAWSGVGGALNHLKIPVMCRSSLRESNPGLSKKEGDDLVQIKGTLRWSFTHEAADN